MSGLPLVEDNVCIICGHKASETLFTDRYCEYCAETEFWTCERCGDKFKELTDKYGHVGLEGSYCSDCYHDISDGKT